MKNLQKLLNAVPLIAIAILAFVAWQSKQAAQLTRPDYDNPNAEYEQRPLSPEPPNSEIWDVLSIADGDTLTIQQGGRKEKVRLCGIDADESNQSRFGSEAKAYLERLIAGSRGKVAVALIERDRYGRWVGEVFVNPGEDSEELANGLLVLEGLARVYPQYVRNCPNGDVLEQVEAIAQQRRAGVWGDSSSIPAWEWRRQNR